MSVTKKIDGLNQHIEESSAPLAEAAKDLAALRDELNPDLALE